jgi:tetratricopeptide (TPR) repeat protein
MSEGTDWLLLGLDEKLARRQGVPAKVPVPKADFEGIAEHGLQMDQLKKWITSFLAVAPPSWRTENAQQASTYDRFLAKVDLWAKAQGAFAKQDFKTAISTLKLIANLDPDDHAAKMNLGSALASTGDHATALKHLETIRPTFEGEADYHSTLGQLYAAVGKRDQAVDELVLALEAKPDHHAALEMMKQLGILLAIYENPRDAASLTYVRSDAIVEYLTSVWEKEPRDTAFYLEQAVYHANEGRHGVALAAAERAAKAAGGPNERAETTKIAALRALGRTDEAIASARALIEQDPKSSAAQVELAQALEAKGDAAGAKAAVDEALRLEPGNLMALDLAFWPRKRDDIGVIEKATAPLKEYAEKHPTASGAWRSLARAKLAIGSVDEGLLLFKKATELAKDDDDLRAEYWTELGRQTRYAEILEDAATLSDMPRRDWKLRWNEAEALVRAGKKIEARAAFSQINFDKTLHVDVRKRALRAANAVT